jgi:hypothetical protein
MQSRAWTDPSTGVEYMAIHDGSQWVVADVINDPRPNETRSMRMREDPPSPPPLGPGSLIPYDL